MSASQDHGFRRVCGGTEADRGFLPLGLSVGPRTPDHGSTPARLATSVTSSDASTGLARCCW